jgi:hypothetical protein
MTHSLTQTPEVARVAQVAGERPLEDLIARVPAELLMAEGSRVEVAAAVEHDFRTDPCRFLRRACQAADYGDDERRA